MSHAFTRRAFLGSAACAALPAAAERRPNIVVILADDQGWGDLSLNGNSNLSTPNIDSLARDGAVFENFYVCAVCAPTRAEFLTGRYHPRGGVRGVSTGAERLNLDEQTIAEVFRAAGYATGAFGKWHNGSQFPYHPNARGFEEYYGFTSGHWGQYFDAELEHNNRPVRGKGYLADDLTDHAIEFIRRHRNRPFFCYLPLNTPHSPMQVPDRFYSKFATFTPKLTARDPSQEDLAMTRAALAMCENIDWNVGRLLHALDELRLAGDTIVLYFSDNGPNSWRWNGGMKGRKASVDEGGLRVPALLRWKGRIPAGRRVDRIAGAIDLLPTFAELAGVPLQPRKPLDGRSLKPLLMGDAMAPWPDRMLFSMQNKRVSVRSQRYRLDPSGRLFDLDTDPGQDRDVSREQPEAAARLRAAAEAWSREMLPGIGPDDRPFTAGYAPYTVLPARDAIATGNIRRSAAAPNCSYFTNWRSPQDTISWDIETGSAGEYRVDVLYTCREADVGSTIAVEFDGGRAQTTIRVAHDPPLIGAAFDRAPRGSESYVKEFKRLTIGRLRLEAKRRGKLVLRAVEVKGAEVADVRAITLTRV